MPHSIHVLANRACSKTHVTLGNVGRKGTSKVWPSANCERIFIWGQSPFHWIYQWEWLRASALPNARSLHSLSAPNCRFVQNEVPTGRKDRGYILSACGPSSKKESNKAI